MQALAVGGALHVTANVRCHFVLQIFLLRDYPVYHSKQLVSFCYGARTWGIEKGIGDGKRVRRELKAGRNGGIL